MIKLYHFFELTGGLSLVGATAGVAVRKTSCAGGRFPEASLLSTASPSRGKSRWTYMEHSQAVRRSSVINVDRRYVFSRLSALNDRSLVAVVTGSVAKM